MNIKPIVIKKIKTLTPCMKILNYKMRKNFCPLSKVTLKFLKVKIRIKNNSFKLTLMKSPKLRKSTLNNLNHSNKKQAKNFKTLLKKCLLVRLKFLLDMRKKFQKYRLNTNS